MYTVELEIIVNGNKYWYKKGICHRVNDQPALICPRGAFSAWYDERGFLIKDSFGRADEVSVC